MFWKYVYTQINIPCTQTLVCTYGSALYGIYMTVKITLLRITEDMQNCSKTHLTYLIVPFGLSQVK